MDFKTTLTSDTQTVDAIIPLFNPWLTLFFSPTALEEEVGQAAGALQVLEILNYWTVTSFAIIETSTTPELN